MKFVLKYWEILMLREKDNESCRPALWVRFVLLELIERVRMVRTVQTRVAHVEAVTCNWN